MPGQVDESAKREIPSGTARVRRSTWEPHYIIPKLAEATKDDRLKTSRPVTTPTLPTSCGHEESERPGAESRPSS
ncbi:hypothetical protein GCM10011391_24810 [Pullulanibacillus camelliae]|uniref:Uncharacterized protein n=1 Tax=Pullulanibacillus camelliae TaxID=1707096 RepID=A0A8J2YIJ4_9BACL|nr:hypothetical protein GCM10011391_24810 [Pullulanibacillus camelliae]